MGIKPKFGNGAVKVEVSLFAERLENMVVFALSAFGEELAKYAKERHTYQDQTGNLTNSIGYAVVKRGKIVESGGEIQPGEGFEEMMKVAQRLASTLTNSFSLIIIAGMNYAAYVEAKGYNVILPAELKAKKDFPSVMERIRKAANKKSKEMFGKELL